MRDLDIARTNPAAYAARFELRAPEDRQAYVPTLSPPELELHLTALLEALLARAVRVRRLVVELRSSRGRVGPFELAIGVADVAPYPAHSLLEHEEVDESLRSLLFDWVTSSSARLRIERTSVVVILSHVPWRGRSLEERIARVRALFPDAAVTALHVRVGEPSHDRGELLEGGVVAGLELGSPRAEIYAGLDEWSYDERESVVRAVNALARELGVPAGDRHSVFVERGDRALVAGLGAPRSLVADGERLYWVARDPEATLTRGEMVASMRFDGSDLRVHARHVSANWVCVMPRGALAVTAETHVRVLNVHARLPGEVTVAPLPKGDGLFVVCQLAASASIVRVDVGRGTVEKVVTRHGRITGATLVGEHLVWCEQEHRALMVARLDGAESRRIEGVSALATAPLGGDVIVLEAERLVRVPLDGRPAQTLADVSLPGEPRQLLATPEAVFIALKPRCVANTAYGAAIVRVRIPDGHAETIHAAPPGPGTNALELSLHSPSVDGMAASGRTLCFAEGSTVAANGSIRAIDFDANSVMTLERRLPSNGA